ncbi:unnamed protein product [Caenorhabditis brenneri]
MPSPTTLLLLSAVIGLSSGTIYWKSPEPVEDLGHAGYKAKAQTQVNLVLNAFKNQDFKLLYDLIPHGYDIDRYLKKYPNQILEVKVHDVNIGDGTWHPKGMLRALVLFTERIEGHAQSHWAQLDMIKNELSPTGYVISKGFICKEYCHLLIPNPK